MKKTSILLAVLVTLPLVAHAQGKVIKGVTEAALTQGAVKSAVTQATTRDAARAAARAAGAATSGSLTGTASRLVVPNPTDKATSHAFINGKVDRSSISHAEAGSFDHRALLEYDSGQASIFEAWDEYRLQTGVQNWDKRITEEIEPVFKTDPTLLQAVEESRDPKDIVPNKSLYEPNYPDARMRAYYQKAYAEISQDLSSADIAKYGMEVPEDVRAEYLTIFGEMQALNEKMAYHVRRLLHGEQISEAERGEVSRMIGEVETQMAQIQQKLYTTASAIKQTRRNIDLYSAATRGKPLVEFSWKQPRPYEFAKFHLKQSTARGLIAPTEYSFLETSNVAKQKEILKQVHEQMPPNLRIAVLNDSENTLSIYQEGVRMGYYPEGYQLDYYKDVSSFLQAHRNNPYDLIITDWIFPGGGGDMVVQTLREANDNVPIILNNQGDVGYANLPKVYAQGYSAFMPAGDNFEPYTIPFCLRDFFVNLKAE